VDCETSHAALFISLNPLLAHPLSQLPAAYAASTNGIVAFTTVAQSPGGTARVDVYPSSSSYGTATPTLDQVYNNGHTANSG
jgi:hypothetical protein